MGHVLLFLSLLIWGWVFFLRNSSIWLLLSFWALFIGGTISIVLYCFKRRLKTELCFSPDDDAEVRWKTPQDSLPIQLILAFIHNIFKDNMTERGLYSSILPLKDGSGDFIYQVRIILYPKVGTHLKLFDDFPTVKLEPRRKILINFRIKFVAEKLICQNLQTGRLKPHSWFKEKEWGASDVPRQKSALVAIKEKLGLDIAIELNSSAVDIDDSIKDHVFCVLTSSKNISLCLDERKVVRLYKEKPTAVEVVIDPFDNVYLFQRVSRFYPFLINLNRLLFGIRPAEF